MVTYDFYKNVYEGSQIPEAAFSRAIARAEAWMEKLERSCRIVPCGADSRAMAVCSVAETMEVFRKRQQITQASVGSVSVRYEADERKLQRQLYQNAGTFLDIYRGVR